MAEKAKPKPKPKPEKRRPVPPPGVDALLTQAEVADTLKITVRRLRVMIEAGEFPRSKSPPFMGPRWLTSEVDSWLAGTYKRGKGA